MKKLLLLILCVALTACSSVNVSSSSSTSLPSTGIALTADEIIENLDNVNQQNNFPLVSESLVEETTIQDSLQSSLRCIRYTLQDGLAIYFLTDPATAEVRQISCEVNILDLPPNDQVSIKMIVALCYLFEPSDYQTLGESLSLSSTESTVDTCVIKESREYYYKRNGTIATLSILPTKQPLTTVSNISFEKALTADHYIEALSGHMKSPELLKVFEGVEDEPGYLGREYQLGALASFMIFESEETGLLDEIYLHADTTTADSESLTNFASTATFTMLMFEPTTYDLVSESIQLSAITKNDRRLAHGNEWEYMYSVRDGYLSLMAIRRDSEMFRRVTSPKENMTSSSSQANQPIDDGTRTPPKAIEDGQAPVEPIPNEPLISESSGITFEGGTFKTYDIVSMTERYLSDPSVEFSISNDTSFIAGGTLIGATSEKIWVDIKLIFPNGSTRNTQLFASPADYTFGYQISMSTVGLTKPGTGSVTFSLSETGELLGQYTYTVVP